MGDLAGAFNDFQRFRGAGGRFAPHAGVLYRAWQVAGHFVENAGAYYDALGMVAGNEIAKNIISVTDHPQYAVNSTNVDAVARTNISMPAYGRTMGNSGQASTYRRRTYGRKYKRYPRR